MQEWLPGQTPWPAGVGGHLILGTAVASVGTAMLHGHSDLGMVWAV